MGMRTFWIALSVILTAISVFAMVVYPGPNYGTDFKGGTEVELGFKQPIDAGKVREAAHNAGFAHPDVVEVADPAHPNRFLIRVQEVSSLDETQKHKLLDALCYSEGNAPATEACPEGKRPTEVKFSPGGDKISLRYDEAVPLEKISEQIKSVPGVEMRDSENNPQVVNSRDNKIEVALKSKGDLLVEGLRKQLGDEIAPDHALRVEWVGPKAGKQLRDAAIKSVAIAIVFIMAYVAFRFDLRFAPGGILALVHDSTAVIGVFVLLRKEITLSTIAAVLTIVGYSISDTVIVYDRIRENMTKFRSKTFAEIINISVSETLSRTVLTSGSVLLSVCMFFFFGTGVLKDFALALVVGVLTGTYSSIYVAAPLTEWIDRKFFGSSGNRAPKKRKYTARPAGKGNTSDAVVLAMEHLYAIILAGGAGTRFWPASRKSNPKQLLALGADPAEPLLAATVRRITPLCPPERVLIATGAHLLDATREALPQVPHENILAEPAARNTAPCIAWAARHIAHLDPEAVVMVFPADHAVVDEVSFRETLQEAITLAKEGAIATIGLEPTRAETGYGYIEVGELLSGRSHRVARFVEKPDRARAETFLAGGKHLWNGGMFFFLAARLGAEVRTHLPKLAEGLDRIDQGSLAGDGAGALAREFPLLPSISIDHGIMERAHNLAVVRGSFGWSDVGSWQTAYELAGKDEQANAAPEEAVLIDANGNLVRDLRTDKKPRVLALVGVSDLVVIETDDALLVMPRERAQDAKLVVDELTRRGSDAILALAQGAVGFRSPVRSRRRRSERLAAQHVDERVTRR